jgi:uncharacterized protein YbjT (DUF2867 family)
MADTNDTFLVTGATGAVGVPLTQLLLDRGHRVTALVHRVDDRSRRLEKAGAKVIALELLDIDAVNSALEGVRRAYFSYPIQDGLLEATTIFANAAAANGVDFIVNMSQMPARPDAGSNASRQHWLAELIFDRFATPTAHIKPTFFAEWLINFLDADGTLRLPFADGRHAPISAEDQAHVVAAILEHPEGHAGQRYPLSGPVELNHWEIAEKLTGALGRAIRYEPVDIPEFVDRLNAEGAVAHRVQHLANVAADYRNGVFSGTNDYVADIGGITPTTVEEFAVRNKDHFERPEDWGLWKFARRG